MLQDHSNRDRRSFSTKNTAAECDDLPLSFLCFGELFVGGQRPRDWRHVFGSVQSLTQLDLAQLDPRHFDMVIVDEFTTPRRRSTAGCWNTCSRRSCLA